MMDIIIIQILRISKNNRRRTIDRLSNYKPSAVLIFLFTIDFKFVAPFSILIVVPQSSHDDWLKLILDVRPPHHGNGEVATGLNC